MVNSSDIQGFKGVNYVLFLGTSSLNLVAHASSFWSTIEYRPERIPWTSPREPGANSRDVGNPHLHHCLLCVFGSGQYDFGSGYREGLVCALKAGLALTVLV